MGRLTTHVLDTSRGTPARGVRVTLSRKKDDVFSEISRVLTNNDGRCSAPLLEGESFITGCYELSFGVGDYYRKLGVPLTDPPFLDVVRVEFGISVEQGHYHVPLLISPYGYSTYRGS